MAEVKWIKIVTDVFDDEKILMIESMPEADSIIVIWFKLLCLAGKQNNSGVFLMGRLPYTDEMFSTVFRRPLNTVRLALKTFEQFGMIEIINSTVTIPNWDKHQSLDAYEKKKERDRLYQAERRAAQKKLTEKSSDTSSDIASQIRREEEKDKSRLEGEEEGDIHSFVHSGSETQKRVLMQGELGKGVLLLSDEQFNDLLERLSWDEFHKYVDVVVQNELNGKHYKKKTHYQAILDMAAKDRKVSV